MCNDGTIACGYFVGLADGQRDEREDDGGEERANGHKIFYCSGGFHNRNRGRFLASPIWLEVASVEYVGVANGIAGQCIVKLCANVNDGIDIELRV